MGINAKNLLVVQTKAATGFAMQ